MPDELLPYEDLSLDDRPGEKWVGIPGLEHAFQVSDHGRVKRVAHLAPLKKNFLRKVAAKMILQTRVASYNAFSKETTYYLRIGISYAKKIYNYSVARLVYYCFVEPFDLDDRNLFIFYKDGNTMNLAPENLVLGDQAEKQRRMELNGKRGTPFKDLTPEKRKQVQLKINAIRIARKTYEISRYSLSGQLLESYANAEVAAKAIGSDASTLSKATRSILLTLKGYIWRRGSAPVISVDELLQAKRYTRSPLATRQQNIGQYTLQGELVAGFSTVTELCRKLKLSYSCVQRAIDGTSISYKGYLWRNFVKPRINVGEVEKRRGIRMSKAYADRRKVSQYNLDGKWIRTYPTLAEAARQTGIDSKSITWVVKGRAMTAGNFLWEEGTALRLNTVALKRSPHYAGSALERHMRKKRQSR